MLAISRMLRMERDPEANLTALELLQRTPLEQLEQRYLLRGDCHFVWASLIVSPMLTSAIETSPPP